MLEREQVVARGDARPAIGDDMVGGHSGRRLFELRAQRRGLLEAAMLVEVGLVEVVGGAGNVAGRFIDCFGVAPEPFRCPRVEEPPIGLAQMPRDLAGIGKQFRPGTSAERSRRRLARTRAGRAVFGQPGREARRRGPPPASCPSQRRSHHKRLAKMPES